MNIKDLIGHKIEFITDEAPDLMLRTDKGKYCVGFSTYPDGSMSEVYISECGESTWLLFVFGIDEYTTEPWSNKEEYAKTYGDKK